MISAKTKSSGFKPLSYASQRLGFSKQKLMALGEADPSFPIFKLGDGGHWRCDPDDLERWIAEQRKRRFDVFRAAVPKREPGVYRLPDDDAEREAAENLRFIAIRGEAPEGIYWRNAGRCAGNIPDDIAAAFDLAQGASWTLAVEKAERLLGLPEPKRKVAMDYVAQRLAIHNEAKMEDMS